MKMQFRLLLVAFIGLGLGFRLPLLGNYTQLFFWFTTVSVGAQMNFTVTVDTGSSDFLIPQLGCSTCFGGDPNQYYDASKHVLACGQGLHCLTCQPACNFSVTYGGSLTENATAVQV